ncbi:MULTISPECIES: hypothetical protein [Lentilactobacillus]|uniref:hypothetical protein n=1 Tax=Lentilactobacillus TaxID=2767893 RepID=UPI001EFD7B4F|nr:hypothetical protein [Lentilactobacillus parabuchneri]MCW4398930.1 hypothetical protein [Lentilactobacillus parabuchneri]MDB1103441.1 hypothetical protein [Lentilactobacillus parabuchneri]MDN6434651.1 hypothetical protein [Lentilactobacillus parabuchneri]MDN6781213.1 hypothetical protein [Lentilactobacillus parabuchneri]MDN6786541.1 hypothetical protein [Lentilactobacillus parabuchneri]
MSGLILNAFGNALTISANMGSAVWTASAVNYSHWFNVNVGMILFFIGLLNAITNQILLKYLDWPRFIGEVLYVCFFSYFVNIFVQGFELLGVGQLPIVVRGILACLGIIFFCTAISLYQRANLLMHPNDDTTNILRFMYLKKSAVAAQLIDFVPPIIAMIISFAMTKNLYAVNVGTIFSILFNGLIIQTADRYVWPKLKHNFKVLGNDDQ